MKWSADSRPNRTALPQWTLDTWMLFWSDVFVYWKWDGNEHYYYYYGNYYFSFFPFCLVLSIVTNIGTNSSTNLFPWFVASSRRDSSYLVWSAQQQCWGQASGTAEDRASARGTRVCNLTEKRSAMSRCVWATKFSRHIHTQVCTLDRCCEHQCTHLLHARYRICICAIYIHVYMHICMCRCVCMHVYIYICMLWERLLLGVGGYFWQKER